LYLPRGWIDDLQRCQAPGVRNQVGFAAKPELATRMLTLALDAGELSSQGFTPIQAATACVSLSGPLASARAGLAATSASSWRQ
jgi:hypothetical protein